MLLGPIRAHHRTHDLCGERGVAFGNQEASMFICGDDAAGKRTVASLDEALGFEPVDVGPVKGER